MSRPVTRWVDRPVTKPGNPGSATAALLGAWDALDAQHYIAAQAWFEWYYHSLIPVAWESP